MSYDNKYLKYKLKFENLKNSISGKNKLSIVSLNCLQSDLLLGWSLYSKNNNIPMYFPIEDVKGFKPDYNDTKSFYTNIENQRNYLKIKYLIENNSDIICLQEVDQNFLAYLNKYFKSIYNIYFNKFNSWPVNQSGIIPDSGYHNYIVTLVKKRINSNKLDQFVEQNKELKSFSQKFKWGSVKYNLVEIKSSLKSIVICNIHTFWTFDINIHNQLFIDFGNYLLQYLNKFSLDIENVVMIGDFNRGDALQTLTINNTSPSNDILINQLFDIKNNPKFNIYPYNHTGNDFIFTGNNINIIRNNIDLEPQPFFGSFLSGNDSSQLYYCMPLVNGLKDVVARFIQAHFNTQRPGGYKQNVDLFLSHFKDSIYYNNVEKLFSSDLEDIFKIKINTIILNNNIIPNTVTLENKKYNIVINKTHIQISNRLFINNFKDAFPGSNIEIYEDLIDLLQKRNFELWNSGQVLSDHLPISAFLEF